MKTQTFKASILAISLIIMGVMIIISLGIASSAIQSRKASIGSSKSNVAFQNADSGVELIMQRIRNNVADTNLNNIDNDGNCNGIYTSPDGKYRIELRDSSGDIIDSSICGTTAVQDISTVKSVGYSSQDSRAIEVAVAQSGGSVLQGTMCGISMTQAGVAVTCDGHNPAVDCPAGYTRTMWANMMNAHGGLWYTCFKG